MRVLMLLILAVVGLVFIVDILGSYDTSEQISSGLCLLVLVNVFTLVATDLMTEKQFRGRTFYVSGGYEKEDAADVLRNYLVARQAKITIDENEADFKVLLGGINPKFLIRFQDSHGHEKSYICYRRSDWSWPRHVALELSSFIQTNVRFTD